MPTVAEAFQQALQHHQSGDLERAESIYREVLRVDSAHTNALHLMGVVAHQRRDNHTAVEYIRQAISLDGKAAPFHYNLGNAYRDLGHVDEAIAAFRQATDLQPDLADAHFALANALKGQDDFEGALDSYRRAIEYRPGFADAHYNLGNLYLNQARYDEAEQRYEQALAINPRYAEVHGNLAHVHEMRGDTDKAIACYRRSLEIKPGDATTLNSLGNVFKIRGDYTDAALHYRKALRLKPDSAVIHSNLGAALQQSRKNDEAIEEYRRALELEPRLPTTLGNLASLYESTNAVADALEAARQGIEVDPNNPLCNLVIAKCDRREKEYQRAIERLTNVLPYVENTPQSKDFHFELGQLYERLKDSDNAYTHFASGNEVIARMYDTRNVDPTRYSREIDVLLNFYGQRDPAQWTLASNFDAEKTPFFLVGFPRSGTTLLDQILDSHPKLQTLEEKPAVAAMKKVVCALPDRYPPALAYLTDAQADKMRDAYFSTMRQWITRDPNTRLVDKFPLNTINIGMLLRVFPATRFIVAIRHPCDCVLSCFMQEFEANDAMANFTTLEQSARLYDQVMRLFQQYTRIFSLHYHVVRYEDVVADFEGQTRKLLEFLDVEWDESVRSYSDHARQRGKINTPSYHQVIEPIYNRARYRWLRYQKQLEPVMELLQPHIEYFGYADADSKAA